MLTNNEKKKYSESIDESFLLLYIKHIIARNKEKKCYIFLDLITIKACGSRVLTLNFLSSFFFRINYNNLIMEIFFDKKIFFKK